jgi:hypothetical protein
MELFPEYLKNHGLIFQSAGGGQAFDFPPLAAIMDIPVDTSLLCGGVVHFFTVIIEK